MRSIRYTANLGMCFNLSIYACTNTRADTPHRHSYIGKEIFYFMHKDDRGKNFEKTSPSGWMEKSTYSNKISSKIIDIKVKCTQRLYNVLLNSHFLDLF